MLRLFADLKFRWKIALPILVLAVLLMLMGLLAMRSIEHLVQASTQLTNRSLPAVSLLLNADRDLYQAFIAERSLLGDFTEEHAQALRDSHRENLSQAHERVNRYATLQPSPEARRLVEEFNRGFERWKATSERVLAMTREYPAGATALSFGESEKLFEAARDAIDKLGELEDATAEALGQSAIDQGIANRVQQGTLVMIGLLICALLAFAFPMLVTRPLQRLLERLEQIADGDGDLRGRVEASSRDELGQLGRAFNRFLDKLQPMIAEIGSLAGSVSTSARDQAGLAARNDELISHEFAAVDQVSTAATEMSAAVHEVARSAQQAADTAREADEQSRHGAQVVGASITVIRALASDVGNAAKTIRALEEETASIGAVLEVIRTIAEQTNLLALNAAIEAARAGDQGRGFAVVADEVRALAARTQESTVDIQARIERLQSGVQQAVRAMESGGGKATDSVQRVADVEQVLDGTRGAIQRINDMAAQIATACEEQSSVTEEIARNIDEIRTLSNQATQMSEQSTQASRGLSELSGQLARLVGRFQV
ncbi:methyl-accepting chemotaxis protein [Pseudomonas sp. RL]|uniref:methyl-accepting chemotaxis protein n=1 Tax=Pseudomonas sp. RL TaxID=1452718 RepID=UPI000480CDB3|nr:methyl-accepting chemotaxis protein [Pseudomonas sp. RL]